jgi:putative membrane protein
MPEPEKKGNPSDHLANERTLLAWTRTSIGIMAFGFVVVKFSLFVKQISLVLGKEYAIHSRGISALVGILLVGVGAATTVFSYVRYKRTEKQLKEGTYSHSSLLITLLTAFIFLVSVLLIIYLIESA